MKKIHLLSVLIIGATVAAHAGPPKARIKDTSRDKSRDAIRQGTIPGKTAKTTQELAEQARIKTEIRNATTNSRGTLKNVDGLSHIVQELPNSGVQPVLNDLVSLKNTKLTGNNITERAELNDSALRLMDRLASRPDLLENKMTKNEVSEAIGFIRNIAKAVREGTASATELNNMSAFAKHLESELASGKSLKEAVESFGRFSWEEFIKRCR